MIAAFVFVNTEGHMVAQGLMITATLVLFAAVVAYYIGRGVMFLVRELRNWLRGEPIQLTLPVALNIKGRDGRWRRVLCGVVVAVLSFATLQASFPVGNPCYGVTDWALWILLGCWMQ